MITKVKVKVEVEKKYPVVSLTKYEKI